MIRCTWFRVVLFGLVWLSPGAVFAQVISGTVTDSSGAVMPGVTVAASSPALIEQSRSVLTDDAGRYSIVSLRPGSYKVTFTLTGFSTVTRDGIELTSDFTAQVNAQLAIGSIGEVITVETASPVVDVQGVSTPRTLTRDALDALPTGRTVADVMATLPGITPGFFGSQFRGTQDSLTMVDGMRATLMIGAGPGLSIAPDNNAMYQEMTFSTAIDSAEMGQPGLRTNLVPRDGGNELHSTTFTSYTRGPWNSSNIDDELFNQGLRDPAKTLKLVDFNPTVGGPIVRNKLWFQSTFQYNDVERSVLNNYFDALPDDPFRYLADFSRPGLDLVKSKNFAQRLTAQVTSNDKIAGYYYWTDGRTPYFANTLFGAAPPPEGTSMLRTPNNQQAGGRWSRTHSSRLLFEASFLYGKSRVLNLYRDEEEPWSASYVEDGLPTARPARYAIRELQNNRLIGLANISDGNVSTSGELRAAASYVTGSHALRMGLSYFTGSYHRPTSVVGYTVLRVFNGQPFDVERFLPGNEKDRIDGDWGFFVQDRWTLNRLTVNAGLRMDWLKSSVPDQVLPASVWLPRELSFSGQDILNYKDLSPRLGAAYDLFGNGKTALKVALARFVAGETVALTGAANPIRTITSTDTRPWTDLNGDRTIFNPDFTVQENELGASSNRSFGSSVPTTVYDPEALGGWFKRGYSWETNVSIQHELFPRVGVTALFYRRSLGNQRTNDNTLIDPTSYDGPFCLPVPSDPRLPGGGGGEACGLYDIKPHLFGLTSNYNTFAKNLGTGKGFKEVTTGYELSVNARLPKGAFLQGGVNFQRVFTNAQRGGLLPGTPVFNTCDVIDNPDTRFCSNETPYRPDFSINGSYILPLDIQVSGIYQGISGPMIEARWNVPSAVIAPYLGRPLSAGANSSKLISLVEQNQDFFPMRHVFDLRLAKLFRLQRYRLQVMADLYNAFNGNAVNTVNTTFGANPFTGVDQFLVPITATSPRQFRLSAQFNF